MRLPVVVNCLISSTRERFDSFIPYFLLINYGGMIMITFKNIMIAVLGVFLCASTILNLHCANLINRMRDESLERNLSPVSQEEFKKIKEEIKKLSNQTYFFKP